MGLGMTVSKATLSGVDWSLVMLIKIKAVGPPYSHGT